MTCSLHPKMKDDFNSCFLVITPVISSLLCLNAIGSVYNHNFIV